MSIAEVAAALIGLRETTYKDHQRLGGGFDELRATIDTLRGDLDERVDKRLAASAQALVDLDRRVAGEYERRLDGMLMTLVEVVDRLNVLVDAADSSDDVAELRERLRSISAPRDRVRRLLEESGVYAFASTGETYDPLRHEVVRREFVADCPREYVLTELRPGYVRTGTEHTLIRAKVIVAAPPLTPSSVEDKTDG